MDQCHIQGSRNIRSCFMLQKQEISASLMGHLAHMWTLPYLILAYLLKVGIKSRKKNKIGLSLHYVMYCIKLVTRHMQEYH